MEQSMLKFIRNISDSDEEFLAIIEAINQWGDHGEKEPKGQVIYVPSNLGRISFSKDEYRAALELASKAIQNRRTY